MGEGMLCVKEEDAKKKGKGRYVGRFNKFNARGRHERETKRERKKESRGKRRMFTVFADIDEHSSRGSLGGRGKKTKGEGMAPARLVASCPATLNGI